MNKYTDPGVPAPFIIIFIAIVLVGFGVLITRPEPRPEPIPSNEITYHSLIGKNIMWNGHKIFVVGCGLLGGYEIIITQDNGHMVKATADMKPLIEAYKQSLQGTNDL